MTKNEGIRENERIKIIQLFMKNCEMKMFYSSESPSVYPNGRRDKSLVSGRMISRQPVVVTKITASEAASSMVVTSYLRAREMDKYPTTASKPCWGSGVLTCLGEKKTLGGFCLKT